MKPIKPMTSVGRRRLAASIQPLRDRCDNDISDTEEFRKFKTLENGKISQYLNSASGRIKLAQSMNPSRVVCSVCNKTYSDLREHLIHQTDDEHKVLLVLES